MGYGKLLFSHLADVYLLDVDLLDWAYYLLTGRWFPYAYLVDMAWFPPQNVE